ncbi:MAG: MerR family transcriptional regulator [Gemmatimonadaceae bacterium]
MGNYLRIGAAARLVGVSVDTMRRWADEGLIEPFISPGGQMQFRESDVKRLMTARETRRPEDGAPSYSEKPEREHPHPAPPTARPRWQDLPPWEQRRAEVEADIEIERLTERRDREQQEQDARESRERAEAKEVDRLSALKLFGKKWCVDPSLMPMVIRELEQFVTAEQVPRWLPENEQRTLVQLFVLDLVGEVRKAEFQKAIDSWKNIKWS